MNKNTYTARVWCGNCGKYQTIEIPKGMLIKTVEAQALCPVCGCKFQFKI